MDGASSSCMRRSRGGLRANRRKSTVSTWKHAVSASRRVSGWGLPYWHAVVPLSSFLPQPRSSRWRSEEHTSELQSHSDLVCRLLLEKKKHTHLRHSDVTQF